MNSRRSAFTLLELLISTAIAMLVAGLVTTAFLQTRKVINRAEARLAMHAHAQVIFQAMYNSFASLQQTCAMVALSKQAGGSPEEGQVDLIFMRAKESRNDFWQEGACLAQSQLAWEEWRWLRSTRTLYTATSSAVGEKADSRRRRTFRLGSSFTPSGSGVDYNGKSFINQAKPRRTLDPASPLAILDDNLWFPGTHAVVAQVTPWTALTPRYWYPSLAPTNADEGDYGDLQSNIALTCEQVSDFSIEFVLHDPAVTLPVPNPATATSRPSPRQAGVVTIDSRYDDQALWSGVWLDGRMGMTLDPAGPVTGGASPPTGWDDRLNSANFHKTDAALRPRLVRVAFTLTDQAKDLSQEFSFSFALPALAAKP